VGNINPPPPVKLFCRLLFTPQGLLEEAKARLLDAYGPVDVQSKPAPLGASNDVAQEMGPDLERYFVAFFDLIDPSELASVKVVTAQLEDRLAVGGLRTVAIDPGYVARDQLMVATLKEAPHRTYLGRGVYAELAYIWRPDGFVPLEWTHSDYLEPDQRAFFSTLHTRYLEQLANRPA
jgi:hypothetical protein